MADFSDINKELDRISKFVNTKAKEVIGTEAVKFFTERFELQKDIHGDAFKYVKRKDPTSVWYGFQYGKKQKKPSNHPSRDGALKKYKRRKPNPITNYAKVATKTDILSSQRSELENSIRYRLAGTSIIIFSDVPYAKIHNEGGKIKVFGKTTVMLPKRQFIGYSKELEKRIITKLNKKFKQTK